MILLLLSAASLLLAVIPLVVYVANRREYVCPDGTGCSTDRASVSVLIPARDEAGGIGRCLKAAADSEGVELEIIVMDDQSQDATAEMVRGFGRRDPRVKLEQGGELPEGWNGKQHACWQLSQRASNDWLVFLDADVRLQPTALRRMIAYAKQHNVELLSAFPRQETGSIMERMLIPMMHVVLLCFLPLRRMRRSGSPAYAAGCGQLFVTTKEAYQRAGTHAAIADSRHDGLKLPRVYRAAGLMTDVVDGTELATCRMYRSGREVVRGLLKNADEGIANVRLIMPFTTMLLGGTLLPLVLILILAGCVRSIAFWMALTAVVLGWLPRLLNVRWLRQSLLGALLHPLAVLIFVSLQWIAIAMSLLGRRIAWRGRSNS